MANVLDLSGNRYGRLIVIGQAPSKTYNTKWFCKCDCGAETCVFGHLLKSGKTISCGCFRREAGVKRGEASAKYGLSRTPEYVTWNLMIARCHDESSINYPNYGGRGIIVCERWRNSVEDFYEDMGPKPTPKHTIERKNNDGNYEPVNCTWATKKEQSRNTRRNRLVNYHGATMTLAEAIEMSGSAINSGTVTHRIARGMSLEDALMTPKITVYPRRNQWS
jgi:hypothetical protein